MTSKRHQRPWAGDLREAVGGPRPWSLIRAAANPALGLPPVERIVLIALASHCDIAGVCWPSARLLARETGCSERRAREAIRRLATLGLVNVTRQPGRPIVFQVDGHVVERFALRTTPADFADTPADFADTPAESAGPAAGSADEVEAPGKRAHLEKGCAQRIVATKPNRDDEEQTADVERALEAARRELPAKFQAAIDLLAKASARNPRPELVKAALDRIRFEATEVH